jgi:diguanylate cyclase
MAVLVEGRVMGVDARWAFASSRRGIVAWSNCGRGVCARIVRVLAHDRTGGMRAQGRCAAIPRIEEHPEVVMWLHRRSSPSSPDDDMAWTQVPVWLWAAHERSQRIGLPLLMFQAAVITSAVSVVSTLAAVQLAGWSLTLETLVGVVVSACALVCAWLGTTIPVMQSLSVAQLRNQRLSTHDATTGIVNRRHFTQLAHREWERCRRYRSGAALLMVEVDHLDTVQEEHGGAAGDAVMRAVAIIADSTLRKPDLLGRYGAETLVIYLPHTDTLGALDVAERLRTAVSHSRVPWRDRALRVTVSVGIAALGDAHLSLNALVLDAESALQLAQESGRNCVRVAPGSPSPSGTAYPVIVG